jgi:hypothetical protein
MELPQPPFFFRIYSHNGQGIIYKALREVGHQTYDCQGTRQGGIVDGKIVWVMADYTDVMPAAAIASVIDLRKVTKRDTNAIIQDHRLDPALAQMPLYEDSTGYLFGLGRAISKSPSPKSKTKSKKNRV